MNKKLCFLINKYKFPKKSLITKSNLNTLYKWLMSDSQFVVKALTAFVVARADAF